MGTAIVATVVLGVGAGVGARVGVGLVPAEGAGVGLNVRPGVGIFTSSSREGSVVGTGSESVSKYSPTLHCGL